MLAVLLLLAASIALIVVLLLVMVVAGIRQEPTATELTSRAPRPTAALARRMLGVHVRRPVDADLSVVTCRSCRAQLGLDDEPDASRRLEALFALSLTLGLRPGELRKLSWSHVDLEKGVIHVWR